MRTGFLLISFILFISCYTSNDSESTGNDIMQNERIDETRKNEMKDTSISEITLFEEIKLDYNLLGIWKVSNKFTSEINYTIELYQKGDKRYTIIPEYDNKIEKLLKLGDKLMIYGNPQGEYYIYNKDTGKLGMFDKDGDLTTAGYRISTIKK